MQRQILELDSQNRDLILVIFFSNAHLLRLHTDITSISETVPKSRVLRVVEKIIKSLEICVAAQHYADIGKQLLFANNRNGVPEAVLGFSQDGA